MSECWAPWAFSPQFYAEQEHQKYDDTCATTLEEFLGKWRTRYHEKDANNLLCHLRTWSEHDVGKTPGCSGSVTEALTRIQANVLYLPSSSDAYFTVAEVHEEAKFVENATVTVVESNSGHAAGFGRSQSDRMQVNSAIERFMLE